jgi:hypothetical protein
MTWRIECPCLTSTLYSHNSSRKNPKRMKEGGNSMNQIQRIPPQFSPYKLLDFLRPSPDAPTSISTSFHRVRTKTHFAIAVVVAQWGTGFVFVAALGTRGLGVVQGSAAFHHLFHPGKISISHEVRERELGLGEKWGRRR